MRSYSEALWVLEYLDPEKDRYRYCIAVRIQAELNTIIVFYHLVFQGNKLLGTVRSPIQTW
jgi:hypothetical protein